MKHLSPEKTIANANLQPEMRLLLGCLHIHPTPETTRQIHNLLRQAIDWDVLLELAGWHGAMPLLYTTFKRVAPEQIPAPVLNQLQAQYHATDMRNIILTRELLRLLQLLADNGIEAVPYKGPALALTLYGNLALRQFTDLDILVRVQDVLKARDVLVAGGYMQRPALNSAQEQLHIRVNNVLHLYPPEGRAMLELHWTLTPRYLSTRLDMDAIWAGLKPVLLDGVQVQNLPPEELLLVLCVHGSKHCWESLKWLCDVALLIQTNPELNWNRLTTLAAETGNRRKLLLGLTLAYDLLAADVPHSLLAEAQANTAVTKLAQQTLHYSAGLAGKKINAFQRAFYRLRVMDKMADRLRYIFDFLFSPDELDLTFVNLPPGLTFLYRPLRWIRLLKIYGVSRPPA